MKEDSPRNHRRDGFIKVMNPNLNPTGKNLPKAYSRGLKYTLMQLIPLGIVIFLLLYLVFK